MKKNLSMFLALIALMLATLACNLINRGAAEVSLEDLHMAFDQDGTKPTTVFSSSDIFYTVGNLKNAPAGTVVEAKWLAVEIEGYAPGALIYEQAIDDFTEDSFTGAIYFQLSNDNGWTVGDYKVDVYLDGNFVQSVPFSVR